MTPNPNISKEDSGELSRRRFFKRAGGMTLGILGTSGILSSLVLGEGAQAIEGAFPETAPLPNQPEVHTLPELLTVLKKHPGGAKILQQIEQSRQKGPSTPSPFSIKFTRENLQMGESYLEFSRVYVTRDLNIHMRKDKNGSSLADLFLTFPKGERWFLVNFEGFIDAGGRVDAHIIPATGKLTPIQTWTYSQVKERGQRSFPAAIYSDGGGAQAYTFKITRGTITFIEASVQAI